jgi:hypothetical protein
MVAGSFMMMCVLAFPVHAGGKGQLQNYFNDAAIKVRAEADPTAKRTLLCESLQNMSKALDMVQQGTSMSASEGAGIERFKGLLQEKQDELAGTNGYVRVPDAQLNAFSQYVVQDMEQADQVVTISLVTLLLILLLVVLIMK